MKVPTFWDSQSCDVFKANASCFYLFLRLLYFLIWVSVRFYFGFTKKYFNFQKLVYWQLWHRMPSWERKIWECVLGSWSGIKVYSGTESAFQVPAWERKCWTSTPKRDWNSISSQVNCLFFNPFPSLGFPYIQISQVRFGNIGLAVGVQTLCCILPCN